MNFPLEKDDWNKFDKNNLILLSMFCMLKNKKYILLMLQKITEIVKKHLILLMILNGDKQWYYLVVKNYQHS